VAHHSVTKKTSAAIGKANTIHEAAGLAALVILLGEHLTLLAIAVHESGNGPSRRLRETARGEFWPIRTHHGGTRVAVIADAVKAKIRQPPSGVLVGTFIASGEAEIGFQQTNELSHFPGVDYLGPMPAEFQDVTARSAGITMVSREREAARALLRFLTGAEAAPVIRKYGLDPL
jgi:ABC-type molybdate transport system substrate-binding protein